MNPPMMIMLAVSIHFAQSKAGVLVASVGLLPYYFCAIVVAVSVWSEFVGSTNDLSCGNSCIHPGLLRRLHPSLP